MWVWHGVVWSAKNWGERLIFTELRGVRCVSVCVCVCVRRNGWSCALEFGKYFVCWRGMTPASLLFERTANSGGASNRIFANNSCWCGWIKLLSHGSGEEANERRRRVFFADKQKRSKFYKTNKLVDCSVFLFAIFCYEPRFNLINLSQR